VAGEVETRLTGLFGGPAIEARLHVPADCVRAVVICHPHPLYGGSMHSPLSLAIAKRLSESTPTRVGWARFNFRGVGASEGAYDEGRGEVDDTRTVIDEVVRRAPVARVSVCGHSFGSWVGLRAARLDGRVDRVLLLAPSVRFFGFGDGTSTAAPERGRDPGAAAASAGPGTLSISIFIGDRDEYCDVDEARALADELGADLRVFVGFDHHFLKSRRAVAEAALPVIAPEVVSP